MWHALSALTGSVAEAVPLLEQKNKLKFRSGHYTGKGWEVQEYSQLLKQGVANYGGQIGWYMVRS